MAAKPGGCKCPKLAGLCNAFTHDFITKLERSSMMNYEAHIKTRLFRNASNFKTFKAGEYVFREGDPGDVMFVIRSGAVNISVGAKAVATGIFGASTFVLLEYELEELPPLLSDEEDCD